MPLITHSPLARVLFDASVVLWVVVELALRRGSRHEGRSPPEWSFFFLGAVIAVAVTGASLAAPRHFAPMPDPAWLWTALGLALLWLGAGLRSWAIHRLGHLFKLVVVIQDDHRVIDSGPYRWVRHPSYTGAIIALVGIGVALGDWVSLIVMLVGSVTAFLVRIRVEERALLAALGDDYAAYARRTARLVPGLY